ncbi:MAG: transglycosylase SLT domain-containing protein [Nitrospiraceae bacterium]|nr:transglycosylase SLT domain-containing protein [Nitrospiraceae bacterium]
MKEKRAIKRVILIVTLITFVFSCNAWAEKDTGFIANLQDSPLAEKAVAKYMHIFSETLKKPFSIWLSRAPRYVSVMKQILSENNIPQDIVFLSMIESGFSPYADSRANAVGPWQFMNSTAKRYGLKITWWIDERRDPVKSTAAAAMYLKDLHNMFGSWGLAMAAYNAGEGAVKRALERNGGKDFWDLYFAKRITEETKDYVPKFLAARTIALDPGGHGFANVTQDSALSYDEAVIWQPLDLSVAAKCAGVSLEEIKALNPELTRWCTPMDEKSYVLRIPKNTLMPFLANLCKLTPEQRLPLRVYTAKRRDTLPKIARRFKVPVALIQGLNNIQGRHIRTGQRILLPPDNSSCLMAKR